MITKELEIQNELGIHARVASRIVREARKFLCDITAHKGSDSYNFKNVTGVISVNAKRGDMLTLVFDGPDEEEASEAFAVLFAGKFGER